MITQVDTRNSSLKFSTLLEIRFSEKSILLSVLRIHFGNSKDDWDKYWSSKSTWRPLLKSGAFALQTKPIVPSEITTQSFYSSLSRIIFVGLRLVCLLGDQGFSFIKTPSVFFSVLKIYKILYSRKKSCDLFSNVAFSFLFLFAKRTVAFDSVYLFDMREHPLFGEKISQKTRSFFLLKQNSQVRIIFLWNLSPSSVLWRALQK